MQPDGATVSTCARNVSACNARVIDAPVSDVLRKPDDLGLIRPQRRQRTEIIAAHISRLAHYIFPIGAVSFPCVKPAKSVLPFPLFRHRTPQSGR